MTVRYPKASPILAGAALLLSVFVLPSGTLLAGPGTDMTEQFVAWRAFAVESIRAGELPLWNPYTYCGQPFLGGFQSAVFYPPNAIFLILPLDRALNFSVLLHLLILGWGIYRWAGSSGRHPVACALAGLLLPLSGAVFPHVYAGHLSNLCTMAWIPWILFGLERCLHGECRKTWPFVSVAIAMQVFAGHVQYTFYTGIAAGMLAILYTSLAPKSHYKSLAIVAGCYLAGALLAACQLIPGSSAAAEGVRQGPLDFDFASSFSFPPENTLTLLAPALLGDLKGGPYWGRWYFWETSIFIGAAAAILAIAGIFDERWAKASRRDLAMAALFFLLALGANTPLFRLLYDLTPGFDKFRGVAKFNFFTITFLALVVASGADSLIRAKFPARPTIILGFILGAGCIVLGLLAWTWTGAVSAFAESIGASGDSYLPKELYTDTSFLASATFRTGWSLFLAGALITFLVGCLFLARNRPRLLWAPLIALPIELLLFAAGNSATSHIDDAVSQKLSDRVRALPGDYRVFNFIHPNNGFLIGAPDIWGNDPGILKRYAEFIAFSQGADPDGATQDATFRGISPLYALLRCRLALIPGGSGEQLVELPAPLPRVLVLNDYRVVNDRDEIFRAISARGFDPQQTVILESEPSPKPAPTNEPGSAEVVAASTNHLEVEVVCDAPSILLITDLYSRDWRAVPIGESPQPSYEILPANYFLEAVPLAAGHHAIRLEYRPRLFDLALTISALAWAALAIVFLLQRIRTRSHRVQPSSDNRQELERNN